MRHLPASRQETAATMGVVSWLPALLLLCGSRACAGLPTFQNGNFMMSTGVPFTLQWSGNQGAVTIDLYTAPESSRKLMMNVVSKWRRPTPRGRAFGEHPQRLTVARPT